MMSNEVTAVPNQLKVDYKFSEEENRALTIRFLNVTSNPYQNYFDFRNEIQGLLSDSELLPVAEKIRGFTNRNWIK